ncbi:ATP-binding protein [Streptomyces sp. NPDC059740]|uniref:ATP-binding protein n=1 Tax=Streptomyces sp. NPDC059740 TaxID=3346926 RepID=UPI0036617E86
MGTTVSAMLAPLWHGFPPDVPAHRTQSASWPLPPHREAVGQARRFAQETLVGWRLGSEDLLDGVTLVVSELVTNALRHGLPGLCPDTPSNEAGRLLLMRWAGYLVCAVRDASDASPVPGGQADSCAESGRGLQLVECFSDAWGWHRLTDAAHGKVVWARFRLT